MENSYSPPVPPFPVKIKHSMQVILIEPFVTSVILKAGNEEENEIGKASPFFDFPLYKQISKNKSIMYSST